MNKDKFIEYSLAIKDCVRAAPVQQFVADIADEAADFLASLSDMGDEPDDRETDAVVMNDDEEPIVVRCVARANRDWYIKQLAATKLQLEEACETSYNASASWLEAKRQLAATKLELEELHAENMCDACGGNGNPVSGFPCMCGGSGKASDAVQHLRKELDEAKRRIADLSDQVYVSNNDPAYKVTIRDNAGTYDYEKGRGQPKQPAVLTPEQFDELEGALWAALRKDSAALASFIKRLEKLLVKP